MSIKNKKISEKLNLDNLFEKETMSIHIRENTNIQTKKGTPGNWVLNSYSDEIVSRKDIEDLSFDISEQANMRDDGFVEIERDGSSIIQLGKLRIVITKPPFSDGWELTAIKPITQLSLEEYDLSNQLIDRISKQAEGILIAGPPGHGKSTFAQSLCEHYSSKNKIVKTVEAPRDLVLSENITQYAISHGSSEEIHDILLLTRPDYTIFDEMRNTDDFKLFADMRLSGVGMIGVMHATNPIDAIQRFVGRIELGVIPQIIDTVLFIKNGKPDKILSLNMVVKVPEGMVEADLARPVVVVNDFETGALQFELYSYGEETVVVPVHNESEKSIHKLAAKGISEIIGKISPNARAKLVSDNKCIIYAPKNDIPKLIGIKGQTVNQLEQDLGIKIEITEGSSSNLESGESIKFESKLTKNNIQLLLDPELVNERVDLLHGDDYLMTVAVGKKGIIKIQRKNSISKLLADGISFGDKIKIIKKDTSKTLC